jgi:hypothetical protein
MDVEWDPYFFMKNLVFIFLIPTLSLASAQRYNLSLSYAVNEGVPVNGKIMVKERQTAILKGKEHFLEIVAEEGKIMNRSGILLSFNVMEVRIDGKRSVLTQPKLLVKENEPAEITIDDVALKVTAVRKK